MNELKVEAFGGFPGDCATNAYVLDGFGHVVYMVSTVAPNNVTNDVSVSSRLRNAEKELRPQTPLVSLDLATNELFTFHRLVDFQKDGKNIYGRLAMVLRHNGCINSFKSALRASDLLREEHTRLRGILLAAVFSALKPGLLVESAFLPLGMRSFLRRPISHDTQTWSKPAETVRGAWQVDMFDLQLLPHGQLLVMNVSQKTKHFLMMSDILDAMFADEINLHLDPGILCLAPIGRMARYTHGEISSNLTQGLQPSRQDTARFKAHSSHLRDALLKSWKEQLVAWLAEQGVPDTHLQVKWWVELEVLMLRKPEQEEGGSSQNKPNGHVWKRVLWPAQLCFYTRPPQTRLLGDQKFPSEDPIAFVQDWLLKSNERARELVQRTAAHTDGMDGQESQDIDMIDEERGFDGTPYMPNAFTTSLPPSQLMYPTPPDLTYAQATPGMSSVDGVGMTPADIARSDPVVVEQQDDSDMPDHMDTSGVATGTYDEDLFEDLPTHAFATGGTSDEPDWDFFEQHNAGTGIDRAHSEELETSAQLVADKVESVPEGSGPSEAPAENFEASMLPPQLQERASAPSVISSPSQDPKEADGKRSDSGTTPRPAYEDTQRLPPSELLNEHFASAHRQAQLQSSEQPSQVEIWKKPAIPSGRGRRRSLYDSSEDLTIVDDHDDRYAATGAFWFDTVSGEYIDKDTARDAQAKIGKSEALPRDLSSHRSSSKDSARSVTSSFYEAEDIDLNEEDPTSLKRKWTEYEQDPSAAHLIPTTDELNEIRTDTCNLLALLRPMNIDNTWIIESDMKATAHLPDPASRIDQSAMVAQILVDQLTQTFLPREQELMLHDTAASEEQVDKLKTLDSPYGRLEPATLTSLTKANENILQNDGTKRLQSIDPPQLYVGRADKRLAVSSSALTLWDNLDFQPKAGQKDVHGFVIHPMSANLETGCEIFLERMREVYISCNLGFHSIGQLAGIGDNGLVSWSDTDETKSTLEQCCDRLGTALARLPPVSNKNVIIYMIESPSSDVSPVLLIEAFCVMFQSYLKARNKQDRVELGLQIIPLDFVASPHTIVIRSSQEYLNLAVEVYNRFPATNADDKRACCGSAVVIAKSPKRRVQFDMTRQSGASTDVGAPSLHICYSSSQNQRWTVAAWTDERGLRALTMCYPLRRVGSSRSRPRSEVLRDIWEVSQDLMVNERRRWRLVVVKDGIYEPSEVNEWATQFNGSSSTSTCSLVLVSVDLNPALALQTNTSPQKSVQGATPQQLLHSFGTPTSTPQASITSPDQYLTATPTPGGTAPLSAPTPPETTFDPNNEADLTIQDPTDESWSVVLPFGLNQSREILRHRPAMLSGYLFKRKGLRDEDGLAKLGVNLIYTSALSHLSDADDAKKKAMAAAREELLIDILEQFRGLVTLARTRGCTDPVHDVVPWHVATAVKGARILNKWM